MKSFRVIRIAARLCGTALLLGPPLGLAGCVDPAGEYDSFVERSQKAADEDDDAGPALPSEGGVPLTPAQLNGRYLFSVTFTQYPTQPTVYETELEVTDDGQGGLGTFRLRQRPLLFEEYQTPVGDWSEWSEPTDAGGATYTTPETTLITPAESTPIGLQTTSKVVFTGAFGVGEFADGPEGELQFWCGEVEGSVMAAFITQPVEGVFTAARIRDNGKKYPKATIDCDGELAEGVE